MNTCKICNKTVDSIFKLSKHITNTHRIKIKDYYNQYFSSDETGKCIYCKGPTFFHGLVQGYSQSCKHCKSQAAKDMRNRLKNDRIKFNNFKSKVSLNQHQIWEERKLTGEIDNIRAKISSSIKDTFSKFTKDELKEKYGWQNRLTTAELEQWKKDVMYNTGFHSWWKTATSEQKNEVIYKRVSTIIETEIFLVEQAMSDPTNQSKYYQAVTYITEMNYQRYKHQIDPDSKRGKGYHLDHKFSIKAGYINNVSPNIIGHYQNLELLPANQNLKKNAKCSITLTQLLESIDVKI